MSSFYTRSGDDGTTGLLRKGRILKSDLRIETLGTLDEANSALGIARAMSTLELSKNILVQAQRDLYAIMTEISAPGNESSFSKIGQTQINWLEDQLEILGKKISIPNEFILAGDSIQGASLDLARTIVRRAERRVVELAQWQKTINPNLVVYLNRLSSLCFLLEQVENFQASQVKPTLAKGP